MNDIEKIIKSLEACSYTFYGAFGACKKCAFTETDRCFGKLIDRTVKILKEYQKKQTPADKELEGGSTSWWLVCPECHGNIGSSDLFCKHCGQAVKKDE